MNLYRIILVDDEEEVRKGIIRKIDWNHLGFEVVGDAENGAEALEKIEQLEPEVVMTDIRMPFMDGLALTERIRQKYPSMKVLIFSGFDDFEYAQQAIKLNVTEYILKPVNVEELSEILTRVRKNLDEEISQRRDAALLRESYQKSLPILRAVFLNDLMRGTADAGMIEEKLKEYSVDILHAKKWLTALIHIEAENAEGPNALQKELRLDRQPRHIECFDNSNLQGAHPVASCVVFRDGKPARKEYRHFNIKTVEGPDDYASMREVVFRRYSRLQEEGAELPDLIIADGGKGQMGIIHEVLEYLGLDIPVAGLAKNDRHRTSELLCGYPPVLVGIRPTSPLFHFLAHIQEEVHRFAVSFHRQKRSKAFIHSELEQIEGIGDKTIRTLLQHFRSVAKVKAAPAEELSALVGPAKAKKIRAFFEK